MESFVWKFVLIFNFFCIFIEPIVSGYFVPIGGNNHYAKSQNERRGGRQLTVIGNNGLQSIPFLIGVGGGFYRMKDQQVIQITSSNYAIDSYFNGDATTWRFLGTDCGVSAFCPCFNVSSSFKCLGDYLKFTDIPYEQRFCGDVKPSGTYRSTTGHLRIRFKSDLGDSGPGFLCYVSCTAIGKADPILPTPNCFKPTADGGDNSGVEPDPGPITPSSGGTMNIRKQGPSIEQIVNLVPAAGRADN